MPANVIKGLFHRSLISFLDHDMEIGQGYERLTLYCVSRCGFFLAFCLGKHFIMDSGSTGVTSSFRNESGNQPISDSYIVTDFNFSICLEM